MTSKHLALALSFGLFGLGAGCSNSSGRHGRGTGDAGGNGNSDGGGNPVGGDGSVDVNGCSVAAQLVYVIDQDTTLYSFDPTQKKFTAIGNLQCGGGFDSPFSMGVDRNANAWVLYASGNVYQVSTMDASCTASQRQAGQDGLVNFGMGFSSDAQGGSTDTLYVVGGSAGSVNSGQPSTFASMSVPGMSATTIHQINGWPELTGNDNGELWGFFPTDSGTPTVSKIDKTDGSFGTTYNLPSLAGTPAAWAFAHYGGDYYVFLQRDTDTSTNVYKVSGTDGTMTTFMSDTGKTIVGAGVSTCAPTGPIS